MNKWLAPSSIYFLKMHRQLIVGDDTDDSPVNELSRKLTAEEMSIKVPKMQVSEKEGKMFALNNSTLQLMRQLEKQGKLQHGLIQVEIVPLSKVPANIQMGMIADIDSAHTDDNCQGYEQANDQHQHQPDNSQNSSKKRTNHLSITGADSKAICTQGGSQININQGSDDESDEDGADDNEDRSSGSSDDTMQCNVCDRVFASATLLAKHQLKKKHLGCSVCDTVFPSLRELEEHKEILDHWSDEDNPLTDNENDENIIFKPQREELERLL